MKLINLFDKIKELAGYEGRELAFVSKGEGYWGNARIRDLDNLAELEVLYLGTENEMGYDSVKIYIEDDEVEHMKELKRGKLKTIKDLLGYEKEFWDELTDIEIHDGLKVLRNCNLETIKEFHDTEFKCWSFDDLENILSIELF